MELVATQEKNEIRNQIFDIEGVVKSVEGHVEGDSELCPLKHYFTDGIYTREIFIPKDTMLTGKIHLHEHPNFLVKGRVRILTEDGGYEEYSAPKFMISKAGTKRALLTLEDTIWITIHHNPSNTEDLEKIEKIVIAKDYKEFDRFKKIQGWKRFLANKLRLQWKKK